MDQSVSILQIVAELTDIRDLSQQVGPEPTAQCERLLAALQHDLGELMPTTASEAFLMAAELAYMLQEGADPGRAARMANALAEGLMTLSKVELAQLGEMRSWDCVEQ